MAAPKPYYGRPENQKNPAAQNLHSQKDGDNRPPPPPQQNKPAKGKAPPKLNKPTLTHDASNQKMDESSVFSASNFALGSTQREDVVRETFSPSFAVTTELSRNIYSQMLVDEPNLSKQITPEAIDYYVACLVWARIIGLKIKNGQDLTDTERRLQDLLSLKSFNIPEPVRLYLMVYGRFVSVLGTHLTPTFPPLPEHVIQWNNTDIPGMYAAADIDAATHNLYEEVPSLGIHLASLITAQNNVVGPWNPPGLPQNWTATQNLLGYRPTRNYRAEAYSFVIDAGVTLGECQCNPPTSGFNFEILEYVSDLLAHTKTYKVSPVNLLDLPETGSQVQIAPFIPEQSAPTTNIRSTAVITSINKLTDTLIGVAYAFAPSAFKESDLAHSYVWSCARPPQGAPIPEAWFNDRNARRVIREIYTQTQFTSISQDAQEYRRKIFESFVIAKR